MFDSMYFEKRIRIDKAGRLLLPAETGVTHGTKIAIAYFDYYYGLYLLERIDSLVDSLIEKKYNANEKRRAEILNDLNYIFYSIKTVSNVDSQRRIMVPQEFNHQHVILQGRKDHLFLFNDEGVTKYNEGIKSSSILK